MSSSNNRLIVAKDTLKFYEEVSTLRMTIHFNSELDSLDFNYFHPETGLSSLSTRIGNTLIVGNNSYTLPSSIGSPDQILGIDNSGNVIWKSVTSSTGPQGEVGPQGAIGPQGDIGIQGSTGPQGEVGPQGAIGPQGDIGIQGSTGAQGAQGEIGAQGEVGQQGLVGSQGETGAQGPMGAQGNQGVTGAQGLGYYPITSNHVKTFAYGNIEWNVNTTGAFISGMRIRAVLDSNTTLYMEGYAAVNDVAKTITINVDKMSGNPGTQYISGWTFGIAGEVGTQGEQGAQGPQGLTGPTGEQGAQGAQGAQGEIGPTGTIANLFESVSDSQLLYYSTGITKAIGTTFLTYNNNSNILNIANNNNSNSQFNVVLNGNVAVQDGLQFNYIGLKLNCNSGIVDSKSGQYAPSGSLIYPMLRGLSFNDIYFPGANNSNQTTFHFATVDNSFFDTNNIHSLGFTLCATGRHTNFFGTRTLLNPSVDNGTYPGVQACEYVIGLQTNHPDNKISFKYGCGAQPINLHQGTTLMDIDTNGNVRIGGSLTPSAFSSPSDMRIKTNISTLSTIVCLSTIDSLNLCQFTQHKGGKDVNNAYGFIAQEISTIVPNAISLKTDFVGNIKKFYSTNLISVQNEEDISLRQYNYEVDISDVGLNPKKVELNTSIGLIHSIVENNVCKFSSHSPLSNVFVYGSEINDFHTIEYDYLYSLNIGATQHLSKLVREQQSTIESLQSTINYLLTRIS